MEAFVIVALVAFGLLIAEIVLPTGGVLAAIGAAGLIAAGVVALNSDSGAADYAGPGLITLGVLSAATFYFVARRVIAAQRETRVRTGVEELVGATAEARSSLDPDGQVWIEGALWRARLSDRAKPARLGDRVTVEAVDGLTLVVSPEAAAAEPTREGGS